METVHFPSQALPEPHSCGTLLCAECARHGMTAVHFRPDGTCGQGHRLERPLVERLAEWIKAEGLAGHYPPDEIAARLVRSIHGSHLVRWLDAGGSDFLRHAAANHKDHADLTPEEAALENYRHGHGQRPGTVRIGEVTND